RSHRYDRIVPTHKQSTMYYVCGIVHLRSKLHPVHRAEHCFAVFLLHGIIRLDGDVRKLIHSKSESCRSNPFRLQRNAWIAEEAMCRTREMMIRDADVIIILWIIGEI